VTVRIAEPSGVTLTWLRLDLNDDYSLSPGSRLPNLGWRFFRAYRP
jgi:hypothetical protein